MPTLLYLHGFLSSPRSAKAEQTRAWLAEHRPEIRYLCPALSSYPGRARAVLEALAVELEGERVGLIGSSLGGFWATYLVERQGWPAVLVNPAVCPQSRFREFVGQPLKNYHSGQEYRLGRGDLDELVAADREQLSDPARYWVMLQTGDETLDYRQAAEKYRQSRLSVEEGGSHTFDGFDRWLPRIVDFLFGDSRNAN